MPKRRGGLGVDSKLTTTETIRYAATAEQLAEIRALNNNAWSLVAKINRPWSMLATILILTPTISWLFTSQYSPLASWVFDYSYKNHGVKGDDFEAFEKITNETKSRLTEAVKLLDEADKTVRNAKEAVLKEFNYKASDAEVFDLSQGHLSADEAKSRRQTLIETYQLITHQDLRNIIPSWNETVYSLEELQKFSVGTIYTSMKKHSGLLRKITRLVSDPRYSASGMIAFSMQLAIAWLAEVILSMAAQYFVIDKIIQKIWTYGTHPLPRHLAQFTYEEAEEYIEAEKERQKTLLRPKADTNIYRASLAALVFFSTAFLYGVQRNASSEFTIAALTMTAAAITHIAQEYNDSRKKKILKSAFGYQKKLVLQSVKSTDVKISEHLRSDLHSSYFVVSFNEMYKENIKFAGEKLAKIFKNCCAYLNIPLEARRAGEVSILASTINTAQSQRLQDLFKKNIDREIANQYFIQHINSIAEKLYGNTEKVFVVPGYDHERLPTVTINLLLPKDSPVIAKLSAILTCETRNYDGKCEIIIKGTSANLNVETSSISKLIESMKPLADTSFEEVKEHKAERVLPGKKSAAGAIEEKIHDNVPVVSRRVIKWGDITFDSDKKDNCVHPVMMYGQAHSDKSYVKARFFVTHQLDWKKLPKSAPAELQNDIEHFVANPKFASHHDKIGLKLCRGTGTDQNGKVIQLAARGKFCGDRVGNVGLFAVAQKSTSDNGGQGESTLLIVKGVTLNSHKKTATWHK